MLVDWISLAIFSQSSFCPGRRPWSRSWAKTVPAADKLLMLLPPITLLRSEITATEGKAGWCFGDQLFYQTAVGPNVLTFAINLCASRRPQFYSLFIQKAQAIIFQNPHRHVMDFCDLLWGHNFIRGPKIPHFLLIRDFEKGVRLRAQGGAFPSASR